MSDFNKAIIITGHYGSGKTNVAVNLAVDYAKAGERVGIADLDIVNPYFRTADFGELFARLGVFMTAPKFANTNLDIPSLGLDMTALLDGFGKVILDVGGDDAGAVALGQYAAPLSLCGYDMLYVVNKYRYLTSTPEEAVELLRDIERVSGLKASGIVNNSNLGGQTTARDVLESEAYANECAERAGIPVVMTTADKRLFGGGELSDKEIRPAEVYVRPFWEEC